MKYIRLFLIFIVAFFFVPKCCFASTNTYTRTKENLLLPKKTLANNNNITSVLQTPAVAANEKIYDFADLYTDQDEVKIFQTINQYIEHTGIDVAFVTTNNLNGFSLSDYSYNFYDYNDFKETGVVFVIYVDSVEPHIFMGNAGSASSIYTDERIQQTLAYIYKNIGSKNYYQAADDYFTILSGLYDADRNADGEYRVGQHGNVVMVIPWFEMVILAASVTFMIVFISLSVLKRKNKKMFGDELERRVDASTLIVKTEYDNPVDNK